MTERTSAMSIYNETDLFLDVALENPIVPRTIVISNVTVLPPAPTATPRLHLQLPPLPLPSAHLQRVRARLWQAVRSPDVTMASAALNTEGT